MKPGDRIWVAGADTLIGAALERALRRQGCAPLAAPPELDLAQAAEVGRFLADARPEYMLVAAGRSGGIRANQKFPATLMLDNLNVTSCLLAGAHRHGVRRVLYLASSCTYPRLCPQPMRVEDLQTGPFEPTNAAYATAKLAGLMLCAAYRQEHNADFIAGIPANAFGPGDDFDPEDSHVIAALLRRMHHARLQGLPAVEIWGSGAPRREFIYVDDLADAALFVLERYTGPGPINLGGGTDLSIRELAEAIRSVVGYTGELRFNPAQPDGMPLKALDSTPLLELGWRPATPFTEALEHTYHWFQKNIQTFTRRQS